LRGDDELGRLLDDSIEAGAEEAFDLLERLVAAPSVVGQETAAQEIVAAELDRLGFAVDRLAIELDGDDPLAGVSQLSYEGRYDIVGRRGGEGPSLLLNGHIDVVPADPAGWSTPPFTPVRADGWMYGRGAGDMKGGFVMAFLAIEALAKVNPASLDAAVSFVSVIEEECTGNGTLAAARRGVLGDVVVLPEPTNLDLLLGGVGVLWVEVELRSGGGHAEVADRSGSPLDVMARATAALQSLGQSLAIEEPDSEFAGVVQPYNVNVGRVEVGDWPSSVPSFVRLGVRVGFPRSWSVDRAVGAVDDVVADVVKTSTGVTGYTVVPSGFRARGYVLEPSHPLCGAFTSCHQEVTGEVPLPHVLGTTTDARFYVNDFDRPALCYGPVVRNMHGVDEAVELASILTGAKVLARFMARYPAMGLAAGLAQ
jgi:acetylornithine deacetylase